VQLVSQTAAGSTWEVIGNATYAVNGDYTVAVSVNDKTGCEVQTTHTSFHVTDDPLNATTSAVSGQGPDGASTNSSSNALPQFVTSPTATVAQSSVLLVPIVATDANSALSQLEWQQFSGFVGLGGSAAGATGTPDGGTIAWSNSGIWDSLDSENLDSWREMGQRIPN
jgi:hypothetical protein